jgi:hypothetical protein
MQQEQFKIMLRVVQALLDGEAQGLSDGRFF